MSDRMAMEAAVPLVLLPGTLCDDRLFAPLVGLLPPRAMEVGDMLGLPSTAALAQRLLETAPPRFALLGFSLGAIVALEVAARAPDRVAGLALVGGNAHAVPAPEHAMRRASVAGIASAVDLVRDVLWPSYCFDPADTAVRATVLAMAADLPPETLGVQTEVAISRADSRPRLSALAMPSLVLAGAEDAINPRGLQLALWAELPRGQLVLVPDAGHFVLLERPEACAHAVADWLARVDAQDAHAIRFADPRRHHERQQRQHQGRGEQGRRQA